MIEFKLLFKFNSPFALLNLALNVNVEMLVVLRVIVTETFKRWLQSIVPGLDAFKGSVRIIDVNAGFELSIFHLELSKR